MTSRLSVSEKIPPEDRNWRSPQEFSQLTGLSLNLIYYLLNNSLITGGRLHGVEGSHKSWAIQYPQTVPEAAIASYHSFIARKKLKRNYNELSF